MIHKINLSGKQVAICFAEDDNVEIDVDDVLSVHHDNMAGELATMPVVVYQVARLRAQAEMEHRIAVFDFDVYKAQIAEMTRKNLSAKFPERPPTVQQIENAVLTDQGVQLKHKQLTKAHENFLMLDALYRAVVSKDTKLASLSKSMMVDFVSTIGKKVNGVSILAVK